MASTEPSSSQPPKSQIEHIDTHEQQQPSTTSATLDVPTFSRLGNHTNPYTSASPSARTSYTRVDVPINDDDDASSDAPEYPPESSEPLAAAAPVSEPTPPAVPQTPQVALTFLLISGKRKPMTFEPETAVGRVKELLWTAWPSDWDEADKRPPAPSYLRILHLGKILQDEDTLNHLNFSTFTPPSSPSSTIVHISIRPYAPPSADDDSKVKMPKWRRTASTQNRNSSGGGDVNSADTTGERGAGCCAGCVIC